MLWFRGGRNWSVCRHIWVSCSSSSGRLTVTLSAQECRLVHSSALAARRVGAPLKPLPPSEMAGLQLVTSLFLPCSPASAVVTNLGGSVDHQIHLGKLMDSGMSLGESWSSGRYRDKAALLYVCCRIKMHLNFAPGHPPPRTKNEIWEQVRSLKTISLETWWIPVVSFILLQEQRSFSTFNFPATIITSYFSCSFDHSSWRFY